MMRLVLASTLVVLGITAARAGETMVDGYRMAQKACPAFPVGKVLASYQSHADTFQGRPIRWVAIRGAVPDPQQPAAFGAGAKVTMLICSAFAVADLTDGSNLEVTVPIVFELTRDGSRLTWCTIGSALPGMY